MISAMRPVAWVVLVITSITAQGPLAQSAWHPGVIGAYLIVLLVGVVAVFVHELAHAVTANALGGQVARIVVFPIEFVVATRKIRFTRHWGRTDLGGYVTYSLDRIEAAKRHAFVAAAGPGANIVTGLLVGARVVTSHTGDIPAGPALGAAFAILSVGMGLANLLPFEGIDGMRLFRYFRPARR